MKMKNLAQEMQEMLAEIKHLLIQIDETKDCRKKSGCNYEERNCRYFNWGRWISWMYGINWENGMCKKIPASREAGFL